MQMPQRRFMLWQSERGSVAGHNLLKRTMLVRFVKFAVIGIAALTIIGLIWAIIGNRTIDRFTLSYSTVDVGKQQPAMASPKLQGVDEDQQPYTVTADKAVQQDADHVDLSNIQADISLKDGSWVNLTAARGAMNIVEKTIQLDGNVQMYHDSGVTFITDSAMVNVDNGLIRGNSQISGQGDMGTVRADSFIIWSKQKKLRFSGHVKLVLEGNN